MEKSKITINTFKEFCLKNMNKIIISILSILLIISITISIFNITNVEAFTSLEKSYIQNEFLDYNLIEILQDNNSNTTKESFAYEYAKNDLNSSAITEDTFYYYYKLLFNDAPNSTSIVNTKSPSTNMNNIPNAEEQAQQPESIPNDNLISDSYRCFLTDLKKEPNNQYIVTANIVTPKNDPMITTPFSNIASSTNDINSYILASVNSDNYTEYTDITGNITLTLEKIENRFVLTNWSIDLNN